jgi:predicted glycoside hydrolase/deacetylase ChbG (UPF0249 family)
LHAIAAASAPITLTVPRLIVNADDFGLTHGINDGIRIAHSTGIVTSASLMALAPAAADAARGASEHPQLSVGLHFVEDRPEILEDPALLAGRFDAQLERFRELMGRDPTHVDSHHHVHMTRMRAFAAIVAPIGVPLRGEGRIAYIRDFYAHTSLGRSDIARVGRARLLALVAAHADHELIELGCHPAKATAELSSSYRDERVAELASLTASGLRAELLAAGFELASFASA